jgi:DNA end-binding protein Ku
VRRCPACEKDLTWDEIVRGFEYEKGQFVPIADEDTERLPLPTAGAVNLFGFVRLAQIDPIYFERAYYLAPDSGGAKAFKLLQESLDAAGKVGIGKVVLREKEHLVAMRPYQDALVMEILYYADEIRAVSELGEFPIEVKVHPNERKMAVQLIEGMAMEFEPQEHKDDYREALLRVIQAKIEGAPRPEISSPREEKVIDLMEALKRSLQMAKKERIVKRPAASPGKRVATMRERHK